MPEDAAIAIGYLEEALELDPNYAVAHAAVLSSSSPPQQIPLAERPQKQERDGDDCVVADPGRPSSHAILPLLHRRRRRAAASPA